LEKIRRITMDKAIEYEIKGLKCDNPECDFVDMNIPFEEYESYVNKPCPKCGHPLILKKQNHLQLIVDVHI
jgi:ssDNA-binding Zn-finger/Zn-ribbon topoisomerase 1